MLTHFVLPSSLRIGTTGSDSALFHALELLDEKIQGWLDTNSSTAESSHWSQMEQTMTVLQEQSRDAHTRDTKELLQVVESTSAHVTSELRHQHESTVRAVQDTMTRSLDQHTSTTTGILTRMETMVAQIVDDQHAHTAVVTDQHRQQVALLTRQLEQQQHPQAPALSQSPSDSAAVAAAIAAAAAAVAKDSLKPTDMDRWVGEVSQTIERSQTALHAVLDRHATRLQHVEATVLAAIARTEQAQQTAVTDTVSQVTHTVGGWKERLNSDLIAMLKGIWLSFSLSFVLLLLFCGCFWFLCGFLMFCFGCFCSTRVQALELLGEIGPTRLQFSVCLS
jgi:hypothetical protein